MSRKHPSGSVSQNYSQSKRYPVQQAEKGTTGKVERDCKPLFVVWMKILAYLIEESVNLPRVSYDTRKRRALTVVLTSSKYLTLNVVRNKKDVLVSPSTFSKY